MLHFGAERTEQCYEICINDTDECNSAGMNTLNFTSHLMATSDDDNVVVENSPAVVIIDDTNQTECGTCIHDITIISGKHCSCEVSLHTYICSIL